MNRNTSCITYYMSRIAKRWVIAVSAMICVLMICFQPVYGKVCSTSNPNGTCPSSQTCLLNGTEYGCYGKCADNSFGVCTNDLVCLVSSIRIKNNLDKMPVYGCFSCTDSNPLGTCPAGKSCVTCNGLSKCVTEDFVCNRQTYTVAVGENATTTTKAASTTTRAATTTKAASTTTGVATTRAASTTAGVGATTKAASTTPAKSFF